MNAPLRDTLRFLRGIGIPIVEMPIDHPTVFPGNHIAHGTLLVDEAKTVSPGDTLHEAAHIALAPGDRRAADAAFLGADGGEELAAIAWCWAALKVIGLAPEEVFHSTAYPRGDSSAIIDAEKRGVYIGFPLLQVWGMAYDPEHARELGVEPFPHMVRWLRP
jgi:hypothetical protein